MRRSAGKSRFRHADRPDRLVQQPDRTALRSQFRNGQRRRPLCAGERRARNGRVGESGLPGRRYARPDRLGGGRAERLRPENRRDAPHAPAGEAGRRTSSGSLGRSGRALAVRPGAVLFPEAERNGSGVRTVGQGPGGGGADPADGDPPGKTRQREPGVLRLSGTACAVCGGCRSDHRLGDRPPRSERMACGRADQRTARSSGNIRHDRRQDGNPRP